MSFGDGGKKANYLELEERETYGKVKHCENDRCVGMCQCHC